MYSYSWSPLKYFMGISSSSSLFPESDRTGEQSGTALDRVRKELLWNLGQHMGFPDRRISWAFVLSPRK
jgi:hypothetical protein